MGLDLANGVRVSVRRRHHSKSPRVKFLRIMLKRKAWKTVIVKKEHDSERFGSYSHVHVKRCQYIQATIELLKTEDNLFNTEEKESKTVTMLKRWLPDGYTSEYNGYSATPKYGIMKEDHDAGRVAVDGVSRAVYEFVHHSDCDGEWTQEQCQRIGSWLSRIQPHLFLHFKKEDRDFKLEWEDRYREIFEWAGQRQGGYVECC